MSRDDLVRAHAATTLADLDFALTLAETTDEVDQVLAVAIAVHPSTAFARTKFPGHRYASSFAERARATRAALTPAAA
jgi:hypothetical protein